MECFPRSLRAAPAKPFGSAFPAAQCPPRSLASPSLCTARWPPTRRRSSSPRVAGDSLTEGSRTSTGDPRRPRRTMRLPRDGRGRSARPCASLCQCLQSHLCSGSSVSSGREARGRSSPHQRRWPPAGPTWHSRRSRPRASARPAFARVRSARDEGAASVSPFLRHAARTRRRGEREHEHRERGPHGQWLGHSVGHSGRAAAGAGAGARGSRGSGQSAEVPNSDNGRNDDASPRSRTSRRRRGRRRAPPHSGPLSVAHTGCDTASLAQIASQISPTT